MSNLPQGWTKSAIGDLIELNPKNRCEDDAQVGFVPMPLLGKSYLGQIAFEPRQWRDVKTGYTHFADGDVLLAKITPCFENGKAGIAENLPSGIGAGSTEYFVCRTFPEVLHPKYLLAFFKTENFVNSGATQMTGSVGHRRVPKNYVTDTLIPLAPPSEQKRIADKLDTVLARVDACRERLNRVPLILKRFRQSVLAAATSGQLTADWRVEHSTIDSAKVLHDLLKQDHEVMGGHARGNASEPTEDAHTLSVDDLPAGWDVAELRDICVPGRPITYGILKPGPELEEGVLYIRVADFPGNKLKTSGIKKTSPEIDEQFRRARLIAGDLLLSIRGSVGRLVKIPSELDGANITQDTARLSISNRLCVDFVYFALLSEAVQVRMKNATRGVAVRGINIGDVRALQIPLPILDEQQEIVRRIETLFAFADRLEARLATARAATDRLTPALLAKAFRGELVPQDPNDEPAAELLKRLAATRTATSDKPRRGRAAKVEKLPSGHPIQVCDS